ncbi:hypothetical protein [Caballeronia sp. PC1]|uniref:hypothetical protein n=1 Tax=unclassified Caballeronia TaxID=2646786 RepID=UPI0035C7BDBD
MFVPTEQQFLIARFILGVAEAGFYPGVVFYLTFWLPARPRSQVCALFFLGISLSGVVGGPLSSANRVSHDSWRRSHPPRLPLKSALVRGDPDGILDRIECGFDGWCSERRDRHRLVDAADARTRDHLRPSTGRSDHGDHGQSRQGFVVVA